MDTKFPLPSPEMDRYCTELAPPLSKRPILSRHYIATLGAKTTQGGEVVSASVESEINFLPVACVGDVVQYPDGSKSKISSGAGFAAAFKDNPLAIVGSHIENGDTIMSSPQSIAEIIRYADEPSIPGFLEEGYILPIPQVQA